MFNIVQSLVTVTFTDYSVFCVQDSHYINNDTCTVLFRYTFTASTFSILQIQYVHNIYNMAYKENDSASFARPVENNHFY